MLAVHEGRHIVQMNQANDSPWLRLLSTVLGPDIGMGISLLIMPDWYFEGDATVSETTHTLGGRGRVASFDLWYRTDILNHPTYGYDRTMIGTGFERYPYLGPYVLGYYLTGYLRMNYGDDLFEQVHHRIGQWDGGTFDQEIERLTGQPIEVHFAELTAQLKQRWQQQRDAHPTTPVTSWKDPASDRWVSHYPLGMANGTLWTLRVDMNTGYQAGRWQAGEWEAVVDIPVDVARQYYSGAKTRAIRLHEEALCWVRERPDVVRPHRSYGDIQCWNADEGYHWVTQQQKFTHVAHHPDGFVAHELDAQRRSAIVWLDTQGQETRRHTLPVGSLAFDLSANDLGVVYVLAGADALDGLYHVRGTAEPVRLMPSVQEVIRAPQLTEHGLLFTSDRTGRDQLYWHTRDDTMQVQTRRPYGAYYPILMDDGKRVGFADYQSTGQQLAWIDLPLTGVNPAWFEADTDRPERYVEPLMRPINHAATAPVGELETGKYRPWQHLWNPTQWSISTDFRQVTAQVLSQDVLDHLTLELFAGYDFTEPAPLGGLTADYHWAAGPVLSVGAEQGADTRQLRAIASLPMQWTNATAEPYVGMVQQWSDDDTPEQRIGTGFDLALWRDRPMQAIRPQRAYSGTHQAEYHLAARQWSFASASTVTLSGWQPTQALEVQWATQWLQQVTPLLDDHPVFGAATAQELTQQNNLTYLFNSGAQGGALGSWVFLRNTEFGVSAHHQFQEDKHRAALGVSASPSLVLLRQNALRIAPKAALYYEPGEQAFSAQLSLNLAL